MSGGGGKQVTGYQYRTGDRLLLGHDTFDKITRIRWGQKTAWVGEAAFDPNNPGAPVRIEVNKPELFGGKKREGGVVGAIDILFGHSTQGLLDYLVDKINSIYLPAYRGVTSLVLRNFYIGNNPYIKELGITAQRIHRVGDGELQWYDEKAEIDTGSVLSRFDSASWKYQVVDGSEIGQPAAFASMTFDDSAWPSGVGGFGFAPSAGLSINTTILPLEERAIWLRKWIQIPDHEDLPYLEIDVYHDDWGSLWVNGIAVAINNVEAEFKSTVLIPGELLSANTLIAIQVVDSVPYGGPSNILAGAEIKLAGAFAVGDMNPAHMMREWLTHPVWGRGLPGSMIGDSYYSAADTLFDEGLGLSIYWSDEITYKDALDEIQRHIDAVRYTDPTTGKLELKLIRADYDPATLPVLDNSNSKVLKFDRKPRSELFNSITAKYKSRATGDWASVTVKDDTAIRRLGRIRNKTFEYPGVWSAETAMMLARRDLAANSREFARATVETNRRVADLKPGDVFKLTDPKNGITSMICRVAERGDSASLSGKVKLEVAEDIFSEGWSLYSAPTGSRWVDPIGAPQNFTHATAFERPYILTVTELGDAYLDQVPNDVCLYGFAGARPEAGSHINYNLYVYPDGTSQEPDFEFAISGEFTPCAVVDGDIIDPAETVIPVLGIDDVDTLRVGQLVLIGDATDDQREIAAINAAVVEGDLTVTLKRGVADTLPRDIADGTVLYVIGDQYAGDETDYMEGEVVEGYGTPLNGKGSFAGPYTYCDVEMQGRHARPYPPANVQVDGEFAFTAVSNSSNQIVLTWNHRDRVLQSNMPISWFEPTNYGPEAGTTYRLEVDARDDVGALILANYVSRNVGAVATETLDLDIDIPPTGTQYLDLRLYSVRGALDCFQPFLATVVTLTAPLNLIAENVEVSA